MKLQPQLLNLSGLLAGKLFRIPEYQRAYAWEKKQRADLFSDVRRIKSSNEDHFMATVVGLSRSKQMIIADEFTVVDIVDGQQRLTTIIILLKAIQKALSTANKTEAKLADELSEQLVKGDKLSLLLLQTNHDTSHFFADYVRDGMIPASPANTSADQNIIDAIRECEEFVANWTSETGTLVELLGIIRNRLWAIFHSVDDEGLVYRVFEVLNSRGIDVSWTDKLKSQLMGLVFENGANAGRVEAIKELHLIWQDIYRTIGSQKKLSAETVRFAGTLKAEGVAPSRPLDESRSVQRLVGLAGTKPKKIIDCAKWLQAVVRAEDVIVANHRWRAVSEIVQARLLGVAILLRGFSALDQAATLAKWERVSFRIYGLGAMDARTKVGEYTRLAWAIINERLSAAQVLEELTALGADYPISTVIEEFDPSNCYDNWTEELRYLFYRYDEYLARKSGTKLNESQWAKIWSEDPAKSIEHIQPQSSGVSYIHRLGNLMMLAPSVNSSLKDMDPSLKAETYRSCGLLSGIEVGKLIGSGKWNRVAVEAREQRLLAWAKTEWKD